MSWSSNIALLGAVLLTGLCDGTVVADNEKGTAVIKGRVVFDGEPPLSRALPRMAGAPAGQKLHPDPGTIVYKRDGNAIPYVFVHVKSGIKGKYDPPKQPVIIDIKDGQLRPHVQGLVAGQTIELRNLDPVNDNIQSLSRRNPRLNLPLQGRGPPVRLAGKDTLLQPEVLVRLQSVMRAWVQSYVGACPHPFFDVTKSHDDSNAEGAARGTFELKGLPAGEYEVEFVHESFGRLTQRVTVKDGETKELLDKMRPAKKGGGGGKN